DHAARLRAEPVHHFARGLRLGQHRLRVPVDAGADVGHREAPGRTLQQAHAELGLELADATAQARLGDAQCAFRRGEAAVVHDHREVVEVVEVLHGRLLGVPSREQFVISDQVYPMGATAQDDPVAATTASHQPLHPDRTQPHETPPRRFQHPWPELRQPRPERRHRRRPQGRRPHPRHPRPRPPARSAPPPPPPRRRPAPPPPPPPPPRPRRPPPPPPPPPPARPPRPAPPRPPRPRRAESHRSRTSA